MAVGPIELEDALADDSLEMNEAGDKLRVALALQDAIAAGGALSDAAPTQVSVVPASSGAADDAARSDHVHNVATATATALAAGGANAEGTSTALTRADHKHGLPAFGSAAGTFCEGNDTRLAIPAAHAARHADGGADELSVTGLSGKLADAQTPLAHKTSHQDGGADEIVVTGLSGLLADPQTAGGIKTATGIVAVGSAAAPNLGQILIATSSSGATWQNPLSLTLNNPSSIDASAVAAAGVAADAARRDHVHALLPAVAPQAVVAGGGNTAGSSQILARADHVHGMQAFGTTAGTFCQGNDARLSDARTPAPHAATHAPGSADAIATAAAVALTPGGVNAAGSAATLARSDHVHALPAFGTTTGTFAQGNDARFVALADTTPVAVAVETPTPGVGVGAARYDHKHAAFVGTPVAQFPGGVNAQGVSIALARADHVHALPAFGTAAGTFCQGNDIRLTQMTVNPATTGLRLAPTADDSIPADGTFSIVYLAPVDSDVIALYLGGSWGLCVASSVSYTLAGHTAGTPFDLFAWLDTSGTPAVKLEAVNWASPTARATPLARLFGVLCKSGDATRRYLGTVRPRSATTYRVQRVNDINLGSAGIDYWNVANRRQVGIALYDSGTNYPWTTGAWRQARGLATAQIEVIAGLPGDSFSATVIVTCATSSGSAVTVMSGIGIGGATVTSAFAALHAIIRPPNDIGDLDATVVGNSPLGVQTYAWLEWGGTAVDFFPTFGAARSGMTAMCWY